MPQIKIKIPAQKNAIDKRLKQVDKNPYLPYKNCRVAMADDVQALKEGYCPFVGVFGLPIDFYCPINYFICNIAIISMVYKQLITKQL